MKPFLQFRLWFHQGPPSERVLAAVAGAVVVVLAVWALVPSGSGSSVFAGAGGLSSSASGSVATSPGETIGSGGAPGSAASSGAASSSAAGDLGAQSASSPGSGSVTGTASSAPAATTSGTGSPSGPTGGGSGASAPASCNQATTGTGVTSSQITIGVILVDLGSLNSTLGIASYQDEQKAVNAVFASYNKAGGVLCRKLVPKFYGDNVLDASSEQALCLQIQEDKVFAVINNLYNPQEFNCLAQRHIPNLFYTSPHTPAMREFYPYVLAQPADYDRMIKDYVFGAQQLGLFKGQKIGILEQTCYPDENTDITADLASIGIAANTVSTYNYGCSTNAVAASTPNQDLAAVLQFKSAGVTVVLQTARATVQNFADSAQGQGYTPKYVMMNDQSMALIANSSTPIPASMNGTISITSDAEGESNTPGWRIDPATAACAKLMTGAGEAPPDDQHRLAGQLDGDDCALAAILVAAMEHAPALLGADLAQGFAQAGPLALSYPSGPTDVTNAQDPAGGQSWRPAEWYTACSCWKVTNLKWSPGWN